MTLSLSSRSPLALLSLTLLVGGSFAARPAQAQNLVSNPGFETGTFADWTTTQTSTGSEVEIGSGGGHSGAYAALFTGTGGSDATLTQNISTIVGDNYSVSFWLDNTEFSAGDEFHADFGGQTLLELQEVPQLDYTQYTYTATATSASTALTFAGRTPPGYFILDDISVTDLGSPVPEASSILSFGLLLTLGLGGVVVAARKKRRV